MTEIQMPRSPGTGLGPNMLPPVSWFEFVLNENLLEEHLSKDNPEPAAVQLIIQFMQQAEVEMLALIQNTREQNAAAAQAQAHLLPPSEVKTENNELVVEESRKVKALRTLALRVACYLHWDLSTMEKSVPTPIIQALLIELLKIAAPDLIDNIHSPDLEDTSMSDSALFAVHLFHRWCIRSIVRDGFFLRPPKHSFIPPPGQVDPNALMMAATETIIRKFKEQLPSSISFLEKCCQDQISVKMATPASFLVPNENVSASTDWQQVVLVSADEVICQIAFDLGSLYFYQGEYRKAFEKFRTCKQLLTKFTEPVYCNICKERLRGYLTSCSSLLGVTLDSQANSLFEKSEASKKKQYQGIVSILLEDNLKQELSMAYRNSIQEEVARQGQSQLHIQVCLCNIVRTVLEGKAVVTPVVEALSSADEEILSFLVQIVSEMMKGSSITQRSNLKCFLWHLVQILPPDSALPHLLVNSDVAAFFSDAEVSEMALEDVDSDQLYLQDLGTDVAAILSCTSTRESSYNVSDVEGQLLTVYEPSIIHDLLTDLYENRGLHPSQIIALNERWKVPMEIKQVLDYLPTAEEFKQAYVYVLIAKAKHCMELRIFDRARQLLSEADSVVADLSYVLSKHVRWQMLLADLQQYFLNETVAESSSVQDLVKKTKTCLTSIRLGQDIQPSMEVLEYCTAFLLNIRDWDYLSNMENTANGYIEMSRLIACACKEISQIKNARKPAREMWEVLLTVYKNSAQTKRTTTGREGASTRESQIGMRESASNRDSQIGVLQKNQFLAFIKNIKEVTVLTLLMSAFAKLFATLKDNVTSEINTEYIQLWPTAVNGMNLMNVQAVEDTLKTLMTHALTVNPSNSSWLRTQADIAFAEGQFSTAIKFYLEAGVVATDFFSTPVPRSLYDDQCHTQVAVLCQFLDETDYSAAFKALQERNTHDAMDAYYSCIWDITILEFLVRILSF
ncbi:hypothetical protein C0Q70_19382 [Pomacea canaliculata]|uniref:INTS8 TPR repeats domain-containing protein n=1 Tax=Pomacea canaliculata TaxID=400727 RepID=A0A2T7NJ69_POMCA|nr:hypothetical protein C0Q70_19382 [Pomacea canaliculata]